MTPKKVREKQRAQKTKQKRYPRLVSTVRTVPGTGTGSAAYPVKRLLNAVENVGGHHFHHCRHAKREEKNFHITEQNPATCRSTTNTKGKEHYRRPNQETTTTTTTSKNKQQEQENLFFFFPSFLTQ